jgi:hypothetical protein
MCQFGSIQAYYMVVVIIPNIVRMERDRISTIIHWLKLEPMYKTLHHNITEACHHIYCSDSCERIAVIQYPHCWYTILLQLPLLLSACLSSSLGESHSPLEMPSIVATGSSVKSLPPRIIVPTLFILASI